MMRRYGLSLFGRLVDHQLAARRVAFLRHLMESDHNRLPPRPGFFNQGIRNPLRDLALLIGSTAHEHRDLNKRHKVLSTQLNPGARTTEYWVLSTYFASSYPAKKKLSSKRAVSSPSEP